VRSEVINIVYDTPNGSLLEAVKWYLWFRRHYNFVHCRQNLWNCLKWNCNFTVSVRTRL